MRYLILLLLFIPLINADNYIYDSQVTIFPAQGEILKKDVIITSNNNETTLLEFVCKGDLCTFLKFNQAMTIPANFTAQFPITIFTPSNPEKREYMAELTFAETESINLKVIILPGIWSQIIKHLQSTLNLPSGKEGKNIELSWAWIYLGILIFGMIFGSVFLWMITESIGWSIFLSSVLIIISISILILRGVWL